MDHQDGNRAIDRALAGLNLLLRYSRGLTVREFSREMGISVRQGYRYMEALTRNFPVEKGEISGKYRLMREGLWRA